MAMTDEFWKNFNKQNGIYTAYWIDISIDEVALVSNNIYHKLASTTYKTVTFLIECVAREKYAVIAIVSVRKLTREEILKSVENIPHGKTSVSVDGGK